MKVCCCEFLSENTDIAAALRAAERDGERGQLARERDHGLAAALGARGGAARGARGAAAAPVPSKHRTLPWLSAAA